MVERNGQSSSARNQGQLASADLLQAEPLKLLPQSRRDAVQVLSIQGT